LLFAPAAFPTSKRRLRHKTQKSKKGKGEGAARASPAPRDITQRLLSTIKPLSQSNLFALCDRQVNTHFLASFDGKMFPCSAETAGTYLVQYFKQSNQAYLNQRNF
jgi:hypothetical protein